MEPFKTLTSLAAPLDRTNVDTDQIIPKQFLKRIERTGYGDFLFFDWRQTPEGDPDSEFRRSTIHATKARRFSSPAKTSAADRAANMLPGRSATSGFRVRDRAHVRRHLLFQRRQERHRAGPAQRRAKSNTLLQNAQEHSRTIKLTVSLEDQTVTDERGFKASFEVDPFRKFCLLEGLDDIGLTLRHAAELDKYETQHDQRDWLKAK